MRRFAIFVAVPLASASSLDNRQSINRSCALNTTVGVRVVVANATGGSAQRTASVPCIGDAN
jgi:hypothetical protein